MFGRHRSPGTILNNAKSSPLKAFNGELIEEIVHWREERGIVSRRSKHNLANLKGILHNASHIISGKVLNNNLGALIP